MLPPYENQNGLWSLRLENPAPSVIHTRFRGHADIECISQFWTYFEKVAAAQHKVENFHDWAQVESYTPEVRTEYVAWSRAHRPQLTAVHILVQSRLVAMGVMVANLALGYLTAYRDRSQFDGALAAAVSRTSSD